MEKLLTTRILNTANAINEKRSSFLKIANLAAGQDQFLFALLHVDGMTMGMIAETISAGAPSTTKFATKLEQMGLIRREASRIDSRQQHAFLTEAGRKLVEELGLAYSQIDKIFSKGLKTKDQDRMTKLIEKMNANMAGKKIAAKKPKKAGKAAVKDAGKAPDVTRGKSKDKKKKKKKKDRS